MLLQRSIWSFSDREIHKALPTSQPIYNFRLCDPRSFRFAERGLLQALPPPCRYTGTPSYKIGLTLNFARKYGKRFINQSVTAFVKRETQTQAITPAKGGLCISANQIFMSVGVETRTSDRQVGQLALSTCRGVRPLAGSTALW